MIQAYQNSEKLANKSDLLRFAVLYHYGGLWFDTDTLFLNDVRPLMGLDFVYVAGSRYNGAVMGASTVQSTFINAVIVQACQIYSTQQYETSYYKFAHDLFRDLEAADGGMFLKLSGCLFENGWGGSWKNGIAQPDDMWAATIPTATHGLKMGKKKKTKRVLLLNWEDGPFSYHWHGHWSVENMLCELRHLQKHSFK